MESKKKRQSELSVDRAISAKAIIIAFLIVLFIVSGFCGYYGIMILSTKPPCPPTGWYVDSPDEHFYLKDKKQNEVVQWLQRMPYRTSLLGSLSESPYTFDEWLEKGRDIDELEDTLLFLYDSQFTSLIKYSLTKALRRYGTKISIDFFSNKLRRYKFTKDKKVEIYDILHGILKNEEELWELVNNIEREKELKKERFSIMQNSDPNQFILK